MKHIKNESRSEYLEFLRGFELKKRKFNIDSKNRVVLVIPPSFVEILLEKRGENFEKIVNSSKHKGALSYIGEKLSFDHSLFTSFFESSLNDIISHIKIIFNADICRDLDGVVMVGGFAESMFVNSAVKKAFPYKKFIIPMDAGLAVAKGAVLYGHDPGIICSRTCRYTYGKSICTPFDSTLHAGKKSVLIKGKRYCPGTFKKFFTIGQQVSIGEYVEMESSFTFDDKGRMIGRYEPLYLSVYISGEKSPLSVDEEGCILLGKVKIESEHGMWPEKVFVKTKMEIAGTEIKVTATMHTGEQVTTMFDFL